MPILLLGALAAGAGSALGAVRVPKCVGIRGEVRYRAYGYNHIVHVDNRCTQPVQCDVWTDVNPQKIRVVVGPQGHEEVLTFRGSAAREFTPSSECTVIP